MNSTENTECDLIGNTLPKNEKKQETDIIEKRREYCRRYYIRNEHKIKELRKLKFLKTQQSKYEKIKLTIQNPPHRNCPSCGTDLYYTTIRNRNRSEKDNSLCNSCKFYGTNNPHYRKIPHNKGVFTRTEVEHKRMAWNRSLKRKFGITIDDYNKIFNSQNGKCKICNVHRDDLTENFCVDHCHKTNKIRGLLCKKCNTALGSFKDDISILSSAIQYLQSYK